MLGIIGGDYSTEQVLFSKVKFENYLKENQQTGTNIVSALLKDCQGFLRSQPNLAQHLGTQLSTRGLVSC